MAAPGERNDVTMSGYGGSEVVVHDAGAVIEISDAGWIVEPRLPCQRIDQHTVRCSPRPFGGPGFLVRVRLGDADDHLRHAPQSPIVADAGTGQDRLMGGDFWDVLVGGPGRDTLLGGENDDTLDGGPGADLLDGGMGRDVVEYANRKAPVSLTLSGGNRAEGDRFANIEGAAGGRGDDRLIGSADDNVLVGNGGDDVIRGGGGEDELAPGRGDDRTSCGEGDDWVLRDAAGARQEVKGSVSGLGPNDVLRPGCETVLVATGRGSARLSAYPVPQRPRALAYRFACPVVGFDQNESPIYEDCSLAVRLNEATPSSRLLAAGALPRASWKSAARVRARLSPLGEQRFKDDRRRGVLTTVTGDRMPTTRWKVLLGGRQTESSGAAAAQIQAVPVDGDRQ